jgi:aryl-alcohol dehydrogenase-like predicted oxidoreductase
MEPTRRRFLKSTAAAAMAASAANAPLAALADQQDSPSGIPTRTLGRSGARVSIVGIGGWHIGSIPESDAIPIMHEAIDNGMTFFDNAWDYHQGGSEEVMGKAIAESSRRDKVFLMTKCCARDYHGAKRHLDESLRRLRTDHLDLWQFHEINYKVDPRWLFELGAVRAAREAQKAGKVRFVGFTGHKDIAIHLDVLAKSHDWDAVQMPINALDAHYRSFQREVVPVCQRHGIGVVGMKALAGGTLPRELDIDAGLCRRYALSLPISTLVCGIRSRDELRQDLAAARHFQPLDGAEIDQLLARVKEPATTGKYEGFKTSQRYDNHYHRAQHGVH